MAVPYHQNFDGTLNYSDVTPHMTLTAGTELTYTVPGTSDKSYQAEFGLSVAANVFVGYNVTVAVPADDTVVTTRKIELNPSKRFVKGGDVLHFITPDTKAYLSVSLRSLP